MLTFLDYIQTLNVLDSSDIPAEGKENLDRMMERQDSLNKDLEGLDESVRNVLQKLRAQTAEELILLYQLVSSTQR